MKTKIEHLMNINKLKCDKCKMEVKFIYDMNLSEMVTNDKISVSRKILKTMRLCRDCFVNKQHYEYWKDLIKEEGD